MTKGMVSAGRRRVGGSMKTFSACTLLVWVAMTCSGALPWFTYSPTRSFTGSGSTFASSGRQPFQITDSPTQNRRSKEVNAGRFRFAERLRVEGGERHSPLQRLHSPLIRHRTSRKTDKKKASMCPDCSSSSSFLSTCSSPCRRSPCGCCWRTADETHGPSGCILPERRKRVRIAESRGQQT